jgi:ribose transport system permease protein
MNAALSFLQRVDKERYAAFVALAILTVVSALLSPFFLQWQNLLNIIRQVSYTGIIALGMTYVIVSGGIDLSVGSMAAFVGCLSILVLNGSFEAGWPEGTAVAAAVVCAIFVGLACGLANGLLVTKGRIAPFIVTLGTMALFRSLSLYMANAGEFRSASSLFGELGSSAPLGIPLPAFILVGLAAALAFIFGRTRYGRYTRAVGSNSRVALYSAIDVDTTRLAAYTVTGAMVGVSAVLIAMRFNSVGSSTLGVNYELDAIAAVIIGGTSMSGGRGTVWGTVVGAITLGVINNMLNMVGISPYLQGTVKGLVIIGAVFIQRQRQ